MAVVFFSIVFLCNAYARTNSSYFPPPSRLAARGLSLTPAPFPTPRRPPPRPRPPLAGPPPSTLPPRPRVDPGQRGDRTPRAPPPYAWKRSREREGLSIKSRRSRDRRGSKQTGGSVEFVQQHTPQQQTPLFFFSGRTELLYVTVGFFSCLPCFLSRTFPTRLVPLCPETQWTVLIKC